MYNIPSIIKRRKNTNDATLNNNSDTKIIGTKNNSTIETIKIVKVGRCNRKITVLSVNILVPSFNVP